MRRLAILLALTAALLGLPIAANGLTCIGGVCEGGDVYHLSDSGYDKSIIVFCTYGDPWEQRQYVGENSSSTADCGKDTDQIYIRAGEELWCRHHSTGGNFYWEKTFDAEGRHKINDAWSEDCVLQVD